MADPRARTADHYATLGVAPGVDPEAVRRAYLQLARQLHPDRWVDASVDERAEAERRMQELNEAWRVLGNPGRRLAYDVERREAGQRARAAPPGPVGDAYAFSSGDLFSEDVETAALLTRMLRAVPWVLLAVLLIGLFVFSAYATSEDEPGEGDVCIRKVAGSAREVDCGTAGAQRVIIEVNQVGDCPAQSEPFQSTDPDRALCLAAPRGTG